MCISRFVVISNHRTCLQQEVIRNLVKRYVAAMIRSAKTDEGLTEENFKVSGQRDAVVMVTGSK